MTNVTGRRSGVCLIVSVLFTVAPTLTRAQDEPVTAEQLRAITERLEEAHSRIEGLEAELERERRARGESQTAEGESDLAEKQARLAREQTRLAEEQARLAEAQAKLAEEQARLAEDQSALRLEVDGLHYVIPGTSGAEVIFNGRIHSDYWGFPGTDSATKTLEGENPEDRFGFRRVRFGAKGDIADHATYKVEIEFADPDDVEFRDVYIGLENIPWLQKLLIGNQKRPYGLDHLNSSRYNVFLERPMFVDAFNDDARRLGIVHYGTTEDDEWNWRLGVYNGDKVQDSDSMYKGDHYQGEIAGRIAGTPWYPGESDGRDYFHWAVSGTYAFPDGNDPTRNTARFRARPEARSDERWINTDFIATADTYELIGAESVLNVGPVQLVGEYQSVFLQRDTGPELHFWGAYGYISYFLTGEHMPWNRKTGTLGRIKPKENFFSPSSVLGGGDDGWGLGAWQIALRFSYSDMTYKDIKGGVGQNITAGFNWYWNPNTRLQFNYIHGWIDENGVLDAAGQSRAEYDIVGLRLMVDF